MDPDELAKARESYIYVPGRLLPAEREQPDLEWFGLRLVGDIPEAGWNSAEKRSSFASRALDAFHTGLFSDIGNEASLLHGLASTVFWGYASGTDGRLRPERALAKVNMLRDGRRGKKVAGPQEHDKLIGYLKEGVKQAREGKFEEALLALMQIKFLGMSFASKVAMFANPSGAAVYDAVISDRLMSSSDPALKALAIGTGVSVGTARQAAIYAKWCAYCGDRAAALNSASVRWRDWDGARHEWRAVDVERAFFALGRGRA